MTIKHLFPQERPVLNLDFANVKRLDPRVTFTRASTATYVGSDGLIKTAADNEARFNFDPVTRESLGLLIEESRTNAFSNSTFSSNNKNGTSIVETPNAFMAPDGTMTATRIQADNINYYNSEFPSSTVAGQHAVYSYWIYVNSAVRITTRLSVDHVITLKDHTVKPGVWTRIFHATSGAASAAGLQIQPSMFRDSGLIDVYVWGFQLENGSFPTSYIPTSGSTETRAADVASITGANFSSWYNQSEGTVLFKATTLTTDSKTFFYLCDASSATNERIVHDTTSLSIRSSGTVISNRSISASHPYNSAIAYKVNDFATSDRGSVQTVSSGAVPSSVDIAYFYHPIYSHVHASGHISRFAYYDKRLSNENLRALTL